MNLSFAHEGDTLRLKYVAVFLQNEDLHLKPGYWLSYIIATQSFQTKSQGFPDTNTKSIGEMLLEQSANYDENDRVNITITVNGVVHNYGSFGELFADTETMEQVSNIIA